MENNTYEYKMTEAMAKAILNTRKGEEKKMRPQEYLCKFINEQRGLKGTCIRVSY